MGIKDEAKQVIKHNVGYIIYLLIMNSYVLFSFYQQQSSKPFEKLNDFYVDGTDFKVIINLFGSLFNLGFLILGLIITFLFMLLIGIVFNRVYFKASSDIDIVRRTKEINAISLLSFCLFISFFTIIFHGFVKVFGVIFYLPFPILMYLLTVFRLNKIKNKS